MLFRIFFKSWKYFNKKLIETFLLSHIIFILNISQHNKTDYNLKKFNMVLKMFIIEDINWLNAGLGGNGAIVVVGVVLMVVVVELSPTNANWICFENRLLLWYESEPWSILFKKKWYYANLNLFNSIVIYCLNDEFKPDPKARRTYELSPTTGK